jgi:ribonuclease R
MLTSPINIKTGITLETKNIITIDGNACLLKDDAISIKKEGNNYLVGIYITDVGSYIKYDELLDIQARNIYKNSYLKDRKIELFPKSISANMSLDENHERKCIALYIIINDSGDILDYYVKNPLINIAQNLTYENIDLILHGQKNSEFKKDICDLFDIASALKEKCNDKQIMYQLKEASKLYNRKYDTNSGLLVGEFSILYNLLIATDANNLNIPYIYRVQDNSYLPELITKQFSD